MPPLVLDERRRGLQGADWYERLDGARAEVSAEIDRLDHSAAAARAIDLPRLHWLVENWPQEGWDRDAVVTDYRVALLRAVSAGHFLRRAAGQNV